MIIPTDIAPIIARWRAWRRPAVPVINLYDEVRFGALFGERTVALTSITYYSEGRVYAEFEDRDWLERRFRMDVTA